MMPTTKTKALGNQGEQAVASYLEQHGFAILARNHTTRCGEVDVIAQKDDLVVFVEVKTRRSHNIDPASLISPSKQRRIDMAARGFIATRLHAPASYRFDVALVDVAANNTHTIAYIEHAFTGSW